MPPSDVPPSEFGCSVVLSPSSVPVSILGSSVGAGVDSAVPRAVSLVVGAVGSVVLVVRSAVGIQTIPLTVVTCYIMSLFLRSLNLFRRVTSVTPDASAMLD
jgi:hypothetical protein